MVNVLIEEDEHADRLVITVEDNGRGIPHDMLTKVVDPFYTSRTSRHIGLGLPLFAEAASRCNGSLEIASAPGQGTKITATFQSSHIDRAPLGDMASTLISFLLGEPTCDLVYTHRYNDRQFTLDTRTIRSQLNGIPLSHPSVWQWLQEYISEQERLLVCAEDRYLSAR